MSEKSSLLADQSNPLWRTRQITRQLENHSALLIVYIILSFFACSVIYHVCKTKVTVQFWKLGTILWMLKRLFKYTCIIS